MEAFCGIYSKRNNTNHEVQANLMLSSMAVRGVSDSLVFSYFNFNLGVAYKKGNESPLILETHRFLLFLSGRIDQSLAELKLPIKDEVLDDLLDGEFDRFISSLRGDFVLVLYNKVERKLVCARDQIGSRPFYYRKESDSLYFASEINAFRGLPFVSFQMDDQWIADSLSLLQSEKHRTPFLGIHKLIPGSKLSINSSMMISPYWELKPEAAQPDLNFDSAVQMFSEKLNLAIKRRLNGYSVLGSELSGGLDSSGITALAVKNLKEHEQSLFALTHVLSPENAKFQYPYKDELIYSKTLLDSINVSEHLLCSGRDKGILNSVKRSFLIQSGPSQQGFHFYSDVIFETAAKYGIETLLSGFGGDEGVSSNAPGFFKEMKSLGNRAKFREQLMLRYANRGLSSFQSNLRSILHYHITPLIDWSRMPGERRVPSRVDTLFKSISPSFLESMRIRNRFSEKFVFANEDTLKERFVRQIMHNHIPQRLEYSFLTAKYYGITYSYPLLDIDLLQFYLDLPTEHKFRNGTGRAIFRESLRDIIPDQIRLREDKSGFTVPSVFERISNDYNQIRDLILRCKDSNKFHYLDYSYMLFWLKGIQNISYKTACSFPGPGPFINAIQILLLQDMQRNGEFDSGIQV